MHVESRLQLRGVRSVGGPASTRVLRWASPPPTLMRRRQGRAGQEQRQLRGKRSPNTEARWVVMGSADPHGVGGVDKVKPGRVPALWLRSQSVATGAELMRRPLPEANVAPDMAPREPLALLGGAPVVTQVEQVIPIHSQATVGRWAGGS